MGYARRITASARIGVIPRGHVTSAILSAGAGAAATLILDDSTDGSGTAFLTLAAPTAGGSFWDDPGGAAFKNGCYATLAGAGASATVVIG